MSETQQRTAADDLSLALLATRRLMQTVVPTEDDADYAAAGKWKLFSDLCLVSRLCERGLQAKQDTHQRTLAIVVEAIQKIDAALAEANLLLEPSPSDAVH